jgi:hypothetical protein
MGTTVLLEQARFLVTHARSDSEGDYTPELESRFKRWFARLDDTLPCEQRWLMRVLRVFLFVTLVIILAPAIIGIVHAEGLKTWVWTPMLLYVASAWLAIAPICVVPMGGTFGPY